MMKSMKTRMAGAAAGLMVVTGAALLLTGCKSDGSSSNPLENVFQGASTYQDTDLSQVRGMRNVSADSVIIQNNVFVSGTLRYIGKKDSIKETMDRYVEDMEGEGWKLLEVDYDNDLGTARMSKEKRMCWVRMERDPEDAQWLRCKLIVEAQK